MIDVRDKIVDRISETMEQVMHLSFGREFIYSVLEMCGTDKAPFSRDQAEQARMIGRAEIGAELLQRLRELDNGLELEKIMREEARAPTKEPERERDELDYFRVDD